MTKGCDSHPQAIVPGEKRRQIGHGLIMTKACDSEFGARRTGCDRAATTRAERGRPGGGEDKAGHPGLRRQLVAPTT